MSGKFEDRRKMSDNKPDSLPQGNTAFAVYVQYRNKVREETCPDEKVVFAEFLKNCEHEWKLMSEEDKEYIYRVVTPNKKNQMQIVLSSTEGAVRKQGPVRPLSSFAWFARDKREDVKKAHPEWHAGEVATELVNLWIDSAPNTKAEYEKIAEADKARYEIEMLKPIELPEILPPINGGGEIEEFRLPDEFDPLIRQ